MLRLMIVSDKRRRWHRPKPNKGENPTPVGDASLSVAQSPLRQTTRACPTRACPAKYKPPAGIRAEEERHPAGGRAALSRRVSSLDQPEPASRVQRWGTP